MHKSPAIESYASEVAGQTQSSVTFDYANQAWIVDGKYARCGHLESCNCYGRIHEGLTPGEAMLARVQKRIAAQPGEFELAESYKSVGYAGHLATNVCEGCECLHESCDCWGGAAGDRPAGESVEMDITEAMVRIESKERLGLAPVAQADAVMGRLLGDDGGRTRIGNTPTCEFCGRDEDDCSNDPCAGVIADRDDEDEGIGSPKDENASCCHGVDYHRANCYTQQSPAPVTSRDTPLSQWPASFVASVKTYLPDTYAMIEAKSNDEEASNG